MYFCSYYYAGSTYINQVQKKSHSIGFIVDGYTPHSADDEQKMSFLETDGVR